MAMDEMSTSIAPEKCVLIDSSRESADSSWYCPGAYGYDAVVYDSDMRMSISLISPKGYLAPLDVWHVVTNHFSTIGDDLEWYADGKDIALVMRVESNELGKAKNYIAVAKVTEDESCIVAKLDAKKEYKSLENRIKNAVSLPCLQKPAQKNKNRVVGEVKSVENGDRICYLGLNDSEGNSFDAMAVFEVCLNENVLKGRKIFLTYDLVSIMAESCQGNPECSDTVDEVVAVDAKILDAPKVKNLCKEGEEMLFACTKEESRALLCLKESGLLTLSSGDKRYPFDIDPKKNEVVGDNPSYSGGASAWLRLKSTKGDYIVYTGIGKWGADGELVEKQGVVLSNNGKEKQLLKCEKLDFSLLGFDLFERLNIAPDDEEYFLP